MKLNDRNMLRMEGLEWPDTAETHISREAVAGWLEEFVEDIPDEMPMLFIANFACGAAEGYLQSSGSLSADSEVEIATAIEITEAVPIEDQVVELMTAHTDITPRQVAEHMFVSRVLTYLLSQPI